MDSAAAWAQLSQHKVMAMADFKNAVVERSVFMVMVMVMVMLIDAVVGGWVQ